MSISWGLSHPKVLGTLFTQNAYSRPLHLLAPLPLAGLEGGQNLASGQMPALPRNPRAWEAHRIKSASRRQLLKDREGQGLPGNCPGREESQAGRTRRALERQPLCGAWLLQARPGASTDEGQGSRITAAQVAAPPPTGCGILASWLVCQSHRCFIW